MRRRPLTRGPVTPASPCDFDTLLFREWSDLRDRPLTERDFYVQRDLARALEQVATRYIVERGTGGASAVSIARKNWAHRLRLPAGQRGVLDRMLLDVWHGTWSELLATARVLGPDEEVAA